MKFNLNDFLELDTNGLVSPLDLTKFKASFLYF